MSPLRLCLLPSLAILAAACAAGSGGNDGSVDTPPAEVAGEPGLIVYRLSNESALGVIRPDGSERRQLPIESAQPAFLLVDCPADGDSLVYVTGDFETSTAQLHFLDGSPPGEPIQVDGLVQTVAMAPEGDRVALTVFDSETLQNRLWLMELPGGEITELPAGGGSPGPPSWSPDGTRLAFSSIGGTESNIYVLEIGDDAPTQITDSDVPAYDPDWSPDGESLVFASQAEGRFVQLYRIDADGANERQLTTTDTLKSYPRWSGDGSLIAFIGTVAQPSVSLSWENAHILAIWVANADGSDERQLTDLQLDARLMGWCPAGPWLDESWVPQ